LRDNLALNVDILQNLPFLCFQGLFWAFYALALKNLVMLTNTDLDHLIKRISLVDKIQVPEALNQHRNAENERFRMIIYFITLKKLKMTSGRQV
jgi:hypothetical protein